VAWSLRRITARSHTRIIILMDITPLDMLDRSVTPPRVGRTVAFHAIVRLIRSAEHISVMMVDGTIVNNRSPTLFGVVEMQEPPSWNR